MSDTCEICGEPTSCLELNWALMVCMKCTALLDASPPQPETADERL